MITLTIRLLCEKLSPFSDLSFPSDFGNSPLKLLLEISHCNWGRDQWHDLSSYHRWPHPTHNNMYPFSRISSSDKNNNNIHNENDRQKKSFWNGANQRFGRNGKRGVHELNEEKEEREEEQIGWESESKQMSKSRWLGHNTKNTRSIFALNWRNESVNNKYIRLSKKKRM